MLPRPKKRPKERMMVKEPSVTRCPGHLSFIRSHFCVPGLLGFEFECAGPIEAAHVRRGTNGGTGMKPGDEWTIPLCQFHHHRQHQIGEYQFEQMYKFNMKDAAEQFAKISRPLKQWKLKQGQQSR